MAIGRTGAHKAIEKIVEQTRKLLSQLEEVESEKFADDATDLAAGLEDVITTLEDLIEQTKSDD